jgi:Fe-S cluster assembly protein SufB
MVSEPVREAFETLGVRREQESFLGGLKAQFDSSIAFSSLSRELRNKGIVFVDSVTGLRDYESLFREWFGSLVPYDSNKFAALNTAVFTGGAFLYVPAGVKVGLPLKSYFRMNAATCGQFGRTLIILGEDAELVFMEGCSAASHGVDSLHTSVGEIIAHPRSRIQYITFQNWSKDVFNLVQMRALAHAGSHVKWLDCNVGGKLTMKYPSTHLAGENACTEIISIGFATNGQYQDTGGKVHHGASNTRSSIVSKSISVGQGRASYRGLVEIDSKARRCVNNIECDALLINPSSRAHTYPAIHVSGSDNTVQHEASVSKISEEQIFYMRQRGLSEAEAVSLSVNGFINDLVRKFPVEYSAPLRRLVDLKMEGSVG